MMDQSLKKHKAIRLFVKGNSKESQKIIEALQREIRNVNEQGVLFHWEKGLESNKKGHQYTEYKISKENAKKLLLLSFSDSTSVPDGNSDQNYVVDRTLFIKSFDAFVSSIDDPEVFLRNLGRDYFSSRDYDIVSKTFSELSDAMKLYVIDKSNYFDCNFERPKFGMIYSYQGGSESGLMGMKILLDNKASGVCMYFSDYENQVFEQLGIPSYYESRDEINHAFLVVKVKNSKGKTLWVPFDYGIGPSNSLNVDKKTRNKYLKTEEMRYRYYLKGIKGAPDYKNFTDKDFN